MKIQGHEIGSLNCLIILYFDLFVCFSGWGRSISSAYKCDWSVHWGQGAWDGVGAFEASTRGGRGWGRRHRWEWLWVWHLFQKLISSQFQICVKTDVDFMRKMIINSGDVFAHIWSSCEIVLHSSIKMMAILLLVSFKLFCLEMNTP